MNDRSRNVTQRGFSRETLKHLQRKGTWDINVSAHLCEIHSSVLFITFTVVICVIFLFFLALGVPQRCLLFLFSVALMCLGRPLLLDMAAARVGGEGNPAYKMPFFPFSLVLIPLCKLYRLQANTKQKI